MHDPVFHDNGRVSYAKVAQADFFRAGLERVREGMKSYRVVLMCAERDPIICHRFMLVTRNLRGEDFDIVHIRADGLLETNEEAERRLLEAARLPRGTLFDDEAAMIEASYERMGKGMATNT